MTGLAYTGSKRIIWSFLSALYVLVFLSCTAGNCLAGMQRELDESERTTKTIQLNVVSSAIVLTWGVLQWDYFQQSPKANLTHPHKSHHPDIVTQSYPNEAHSSLLFTFLSQPVFFPSVGTSVS